MLSSDNIILMNLTTKGKKMAEGKKLYSLGEIYLITVNAFRSVRDFKRARKSGVLDEKLQERIMLAVTAVNKCEMCSYAHTKMALEAGLSDEEIKSFLDYDIPESALEDSTALIFAQHYADTRAKLSRRAWRKVLKKYGREKTAGILGATRMIMMGNAMGIIAGSITNRLNGKGGDKRSNVFYELAFMILFLPMIIFASINAAMLNLLKAPIIKFY